MATLTDEMLEVLIVETVATLPKDLLTSFRNPPGRRPAETLRLISTALANLDDAMAELIIRDIVDATVFQTLYLITSGFKEARLSTAISRGEECDRLDDAVLHEVYRSPIKPGGTRPDH